MLAVVTGASNGIGYELAAELARRGYDLVIASAGERLTQAGQNLRAFGRTVTEASVDLATPDGVEELWQQVEQLGNHVDVACINAGVGVGGLFKDTDLDEELNMVNLNCTSTVHLAKYVVRQMTRERQGADPLHRFDCGRDGGAAGGCLRRDQGVCAVVCAQPSVRTEGQQLTVTALQPGPTDTDFFHRAGMDDTKVGQRGQVGEPAGRCGATGNRRAVRRQGPRLCGFSKDQDRGQAGECDSG